MGPHNITLPSGLSEDQLAARNSFLEQNQREAAALSQRLLLAQQQQRDAEFQNRLCEATGLSRENLIALREWLRNNL